MVFDLRSPLCMSTRQCGLSGVAYDSSQLVRRADLDVDDDNNPWNYTPVSLAEMWTQMRLTPQGAPPSTPEDDLIMDMVGAIVDGLEGTSGWLGRVLTPQHWTLTLPGLRAGLERIHLPFPPLQSVAGITYTDTNGDVQTLDTDLYTVAAARSDKDDSVGFIRIPPGTTLPAMKTERDSVTVTFVAGYPNGACDRVIKGYIRMAAATMFENRESVIVIPGALPYELPGWNGILENKRVRGMFA